MATLVLKGDPAAALALLRGAAVPMHSWLDGCWALLFSHSDDFARGEHGTDAWLEAAKRCFTEVAVRPLAVARLAQPPDRGWIARLSGDPRIVVLHDPEGGRPEFRDNRAHQLHDDIAGTGGRFVMIVDTEMSRYRTFVYTNPEELPSPLDLVSRVDAARSQPGSSGWPPRVAVRVDRRPHGRVNR